MKNYDLLLWVSDMDVLPHEKLVLFTLVRFADDKCECYPSRKTVAKAAACSVDTIDRVVKNLAKIGLITVTKRNAARGGPSSNLYRLNATTTPAAVSGQGSRTDTTRVAADSGWGSRSRAATGTNQPNYPDELSPLPPKGLAGVL